MTKRQIPIYRTNRHHIFGRSSPCLCCFGSVFFNDISLSPPYVAVLWLLLLQKANTFEADTDYLDTEKDAFMMDYPYTAQVFEEYEKRFAEARLARPFRDPSDEKDRHEILCEVREMLCLDRIPTPDIEILNQKEAQHVPICGRSMHALHRNP